MAIPIDHFEQYIDATILKRGYAYFHEEAITDFEEIS